ncbi:MAG: tetratricopeptide repeat protein [Planctomycetes bacterium]|nr:tetratricopeptide repeat protein [Planctomycetota bacterium]
MKQVPKNLHILLICVVLALVTIIAYEQIRNYEFTDFDDQIYVSENQHVKDGFTRDGIIWAFTEADINYWQPLTWISHMLDCQLFGLNSGMHHLSNLFLHIANTLLLFLVLRRMTGAIWCSGFVAAAFALHPLHVESVAWIAERKDVLSTFFWLLTMWAYVRYTERPGINRYLPVFLFFVLGLMSKPMLVTLPFVLLLLDYWPLGRFKNIKGLIIEKIPLFALSAVVIYLSSSAIQHLGTIESLQSIPMKLRIANALVSYVGYIEKMVWPCNLAVFYPYPEMLPMRQWVISLVILAVVSGGVIFTAKRWRYLTMGWLWYLGVLVPVIGLVQTGLWPAMADRFSYLPLVGLFIMAAWGVSELSRKWRYQKAVVGIGAIIVLSAMVICTRTQVRYWENNTSLFERALAVTKNNYVMHYNLGRVLHKQNRLDEAIGHYNMTLRIAPRHIKAYNNLGLALWSQGKFDEAVNSFHEAIEVKPDYPETYNNLGVTLQSQGKLEEATNYFVRSLELEPNSALFHNNLGKALKEQERSEEAVGHFNRALEIDENSALAYNNLGLMLQLQGDFYEAIKHFRRAIQIDSGYAEARNNLGVLLGTQGRFDEAIEQFHKALEIEGDSAETHFNLGFALRLRGRFDEAIEQFRETLRTGPDDAGVHYNLGMAFKSQGKFNEAGNHFRQALELNPNYAEAHYDLGMTLVATDEANEAIKHFREAVRLNSDNWEALNGLAWLLATAFEKPNSEEAIALAERAAKLTKYQNAFVLDTLAAAYASGQKYDYAVDTAEAAMELALKKRATKLAEEIGGRLELYKQKKPYRASEQK